MISKTKGLRIAVLGIWNSIYDISNILLMTTFTFAVYSMFGVNFFKGNMNYCDVTGIDSRL